MSDLHTPPPSYESAMGISAPQSRTNPYFRTTPPSASPDVTTTSPDAIISAPYHPTPMAPHSSRTTQQPQPVYTSHVYSATPQTNVLRRQQSNSENKTCQSVVTALIVLIVIVYILVKVAGAGSMKAKHSSFDSYENRYFNKMN